MEDGYHERFLCGLGCNSSKEIEFSLASEDCNRLEQEFDALGMPRIARWRIATVQNSSLMQQAGPTLQANVDNSMEMNPANAQFYLTVAKMGLTNVCCYQLQTRSDHCLLPLPVKVFD